MSKIRARQAIPFRSEYRNGLSTDVKIRHLRVRLYQREIESESDIASDLLHCFQSVCLYYIVV